MEDQRIRVGVLDAHTYIGRALIRLLLRHPRIQITAIQTLLSLPSQAVDLVGEFRGRSELPMTEDYDPATLRELCQAVFLCVPHGEALTIVPSLVESGLRVFDMSADFRFRDRATYQEIFGREHPIPEWNLRAIYGLPELYRPNIVGASLVALPGGNATAVVLALAPLMRKELIERGSLIADCKCGLSSMERLPVPQSLFCEADSNVFPTLSSMWHHRPEIEEQLYRNSGVPQPVTFIPHSVPMQHGTLATCYAKLREDLGEDALRRLYQDFYANEEFIRILGRGESPQTGDVLGTNFCDIAIHFDARTHCLVAIAAIDNLMKGSAGQAVQCINLSFGMEESLGLR